MRIAFITDLHVGSEMEKPQGVDVRQNLVKALAFLPEIRPDYLVIGGDVCYQSGDRAIYQWVRQQLEPLSVPYYLIAGNHDDSVMLAEELHQTELLHGDEVYFARTSGGRLTLFLDTAKGWCSDRQLQWLSDELADVAHPVLIFMHHPPLLAGVGHMDAEYAFQQSDRVMNLLHHLKVPVTVVCGHYHVEKVVQSGNVTVLITPSLFFQMKHDPVKMVIDHYRIAVREINLTPDGMTSTVHYL